MSYDGQVTSKMVLDALHELERKGSTKVMQELEEAEPDLAEHVIEGSQPYQRLSRDCSDPRVTRSIYRLVRRLVLVGLMSLRRAHYELWREQTARTPLAELDVDDNDGRDSDADDRDQPRNGGPPPELT